MKVALVHDHLVQYGGAEKVLKALHDIFPEAPIFTLLYDQKTMGNDFVKKDIRPSFLQDLPFGLKKYQWYLPLMPAATKRHDLTGYDLVISSASAMAKGVITGPHTLHLCYCHTPTRYLWTDTHSYLKELNTNRLLKKIIPLYLTRLRKWDQLAAQRVDYFVANSKNVADRIAKYYRRDSEVIYPPVEIDQFYTAEQLNHYYLAGGRLVPYKRFDIIVNAFNKLGIPLKIFGTGPEEAKLRKMARPHIEFLGKVSDQRKAELYAHCLAFINPQEEDFGITAVEAMAAGRPVIAYPLGGALETVVPGVTGEFFEEQNWESLGDAVIRFKPENYDSKKIRQQAEKFSLEEFKKRIMDYIEKMYQEFKGRKMV
ncbi:glycosyltransferase [Candidatus Falkowbacteria bacterium]|nr:glycosyltransferase [Candidatus Falkowbacteria bacterium]